MRVPSPTLTDQENPARLAGHGTRADSRPQMAVERTYLVETVAVNVVFLPADVPALPQSQEERRAGAWWSRAAWRMAGATGHATGARVPAGSGIVPCGGRCSTWARSTAVRRPRGARCSPSSMSGGGLASSSRSSRQIARSPRLGKGLPNARHGYSRDGRHNILNLKGVKHAPSGHPLDHASSILRDGVYPSTCR